MPSHLTVRGLRRAELITTEFDTAVRFHERLFDWMVLRTESGVDCWVDERRSARIRSAKKSESTAVGPDPRDGEPCWLDLATEEVARPDPSGAVLGLTATTKTWGS